MDKIRIEAASLPLVIAKAYELSRPQGMGHLHYQPGSVRKDIVEELIRHGEKHRGIYMDYVMGRAVKLSILRDEEGWYIQDGERWYDHSAEDWTDLKAAILVGAE